MLKILKKMILHTKDDSDLDKPHMGRDDDFEPRDDYHIPEPEDIRRLPTPGFQEPQRPIEQGYGREPQPMSMPERRPLAPMRVPEARPVPAEPPIYRRSLEDSVNEILYRLDNIERRLAMLEGYAPQPRRY